VTSHLLSARARDDESTTVSEDQEAEAIASVIALRASNPGMKPEAIGQRLGLHPATVRRYLALPLARAAVAEACSAALDGARMVLADHAEEMAETVAALATVGPDNPATVPVDSLRLKAAVAGLDRLEAMAPAAPTTVVTVNTAVVNRGPEAFQALDTMLAEDDENG
jgi:hypothetical protein